MRLRVVLDSPSLVRLRLACEEAKEEPLANLLDRVATESGAGPYLDWNVFAAVIEAVGETNGIKMPAKRWKLLQTTLAVKDESAAPVIRRVHKAGKVEPDPLSGLFADEGAKRVLEFEPDTDLRDTEQVPLLEDGGVDVFFRREVLPYAPDAWIDRESTRVGYEVSFTKYFYKPVPLRTLEEIRADIEELERESDGLLSKLFEAVG